MDSVIRFREIGKELGDLYEKKNAAYGSSFSDTYNKLGIVSAVTRISDKFNRLCNLVKHPEIDDIDESLEDTLRDMASYCIMTVMAMENDMANGKTIVEVHDGNNKDYFRFIAVEDTKISYESSDEAQVPYVPNIKYKRNNDGKWSTLYDGRSIKMKKGDTIYFKGDNSSGFSFSTDVFTRFVCHKGKFKCCGNIMSLLYGDDFENKVTIPNGFCFYSLFEECNGLIDASNLILPATTLADGCYMEMFYGCSGLTTAPELPATILAEDCYCDMFAGCTSLTTAPELPATTLADNCYNGMFSFCKNLTSTPELPATTLAVGCYANMFNGCTSLTTAPSILPATTLADSCYYAMFISCTSLTTAPTLPATTLAECCYSYMFFECTNLTTAPELPATTLVVGCYQYMFDNCWRLTTAPELPATTLADYCYEQMFSGCTSLTKAPSILPATTLGENSYSYMFAYCTSLTTVPELPDTILDDICYYNMFFNCKSLTNEPKNNGITFKDSVSCESSADTFNEKMDIE